MFKRIVLAYDGSPGTDAALHQAAELAELSRAELHLLGVVAISASTAYAATYEVGYFFASEEDAVEKALEAAIDKLGDRVSVHTKIRTGDPADQIAAHAHEVGADLVVIGHSDKGFLARWFEGSTGAKLIRDLPCNLLVATAD